MAKKIMIKVIDVKVVTKTSRTTQREYQELTIIGDKRTKENLSYQYNGENIQFKGILEKGLTVPEINDILEVYYQDVNHYNSILSLKKQECLISAEELLNMYHTPINLTEKGIDLPWRAETMTKSTKTETPETQGSNFLEIPGSFFYSYLKEPNNKGDYASNKYEINLSVSSGVAKKLEDLGVQVKSSLGLPNKEEMQGHFVKVKSKKQPKVINNGEEMTEIPLVSNGSTGIVTCGTYNNRESNIKQGKGGKKCLGLAKVVFTNLVEYTPQSTTTLLTDE